MDDLTARQQAGLGADGLKQALTNRTAGATILLSHTPMRPTPEELRGVNLLLSGHTHNGQIWPFAWLVRLAYPRVTGGHEVLGMTLVVLRGTGAWWPPMRLFRRSEISRITLRRA